jgi:GlpG protein
VGDGVYGLRGTLVLLGTYHQPRLLQGLVDYLQTQNITTTVRVLDGRTAEVWVEEAQLPEANAIWLTFLNEPTAAKFQDAAWQVDRPSALFQYQHTSLNLWSRTLSLNPFVLLVALASIVIFASLHLFSPEPTYRLLQFDTQYIANWFTPIFMHFDALHLIFNLMWWVYLGNKIALNYGSRCLLLVTLTSALLSNWMQYYLVGPNFGGMSGVVYALCGFVWLNGVRYPNQEKILPNAMIGMMLVWMAIGFADVLYVSMANWAHLFGLLSGALLGYSWPRAKNTISDKGIS